MNSITDQAMKEEMAGAKQYCIVLLKQGPQFKEGTNEHVVWEHLRLNFALREEGRLPIFCPITDKSDSRGVGIFVGDVEEVEKIMQADPGVLAGVFTYEVHPCFSFPGHALP